MLLRSDTYTKRYTFKSGRQGVGYWLGDFVSERASGFGSGRDEIPGDFHDVAKPTTVIRNRACGNTPQRQSSLNVLSKTAEYALRAVTCLAERETSGRNPSSADTLASITKVPRRYLNRVLKDLVAAELVLSRCGPRGGYELARAADQITILDVVNAVGKLERIHSCPLGLKTHTSLCPLHAELDRAYAATERGFAAVTMKQLLESTSPIVPLCESP